MPRRDTKPENNRILTEAGWTVIRVWEHEDVQEAAERIDRAVRCAIGQPPL